MSFGWIAAGSAVLGAGASLAGAKKQADASKDASRLQMQQFETLNRQQQPFIQSGYGALGKLNTLLGLGSRPQPGAMPLGGNASLMPRGSVGSRIADRVGARMGGQGMQVPRLQGGMNPRLRQILMLRAANGDTEAERMMGML